MNEQPHEYAEDRPLGAWLELRLERKPISGCLRTPDGQEERFQGWLGFVEALRRLDSLRKETQ